jgi:hypothetical protein
MDDSQLRTIWQQRQVNDRHAHLSEPLTILMKHMLAKKVRQLGKLAEVWDEVIPQNIRDHTAMDGFQKGVLTVMVDSASHRFLLQTLLNNGLQKEIQSRFASPINKIRLVPGQFYAVDLAGQKRYEF